MKKYLIIIFFFSFFLLQKNAFADDQVSLYFFYGQGCHFCEKEEIFLEQLERENKNIKINRYEVFYNEDNSLLLTYIGKERNADVSGVPILFFGTKHISGYQDENTTGKEIKEAVDNCLSDKCEDKIRPLTENYQKQTGEEDREDKQNSLKEILKAWRLPITLMISFFVLFLVFIISRFIE